MGKVVVGFITFLLLTVPLLSEGQPRGCPYKAGQKFSASEIVILVKAKIRSHVVLTRGSVNQYTCIYSKLSDGLVQLVEPDPKPARGIIKIK